MESPVAGTGTEQGAWIETWARRIERLGLSPVAMPLLEFARAFGFLGSHALLIAQPLAHGIVDDESFERATALLESPALLDRLRDRLERKGS